jgi:hypothetical protein
MTNPARIAIAVMRCRCGRRRRPLGCWRQVNILQERKMLQIRKGMLYKLAELAIHPSIATLNHRGNGPSPLGYWPPVNIPAEPILV